MTTVRRRPDAVAKLRGEAQYTADMRRPGMVFGVVVRSPHAAARIIRISVASAAAAAGVVTVLTAADVPSWPIGLFIQDEPLLASDEVRYVGEPVALVAAESLAQAQRAAALVEVAYELLGPVLNLDEALGDDSRPVALGRSNVTEESTIQRGDVDALFIEAHRIVATTIESQRVHQAYIEPKAVLAEIVDEVLTVHASTQSPFEVRGHLARLLDLPLSRVVVRAPSIGGGFGGKLHLGLAGFAAVLCLAAHRPVRIVSTRAEEFQTPAPRENARVCLESAVAADGRILARRARLHLDCGAYAYDTPPIAAVAAMQACGPYAIDAIDIASYSYYTNTVPTGSFRGPSAPQMAYAVEKHMNDIAAELGLDPVGVRSINAMRAGSKGPTGQVIVDDAFVDVLGRGARTVNAWMEEDVELAASERRGVGLGCAWWTVSPVGGAVSLTMNEDGSVQVHTGATEIGTGAIVSALRTVVSKVLTVEEDVVAIAMGGTDTGPYDFGSQGSRTLYGVGTATGQASEELRRLLVEEYARQREVGIDDIVLDDGHLLVRGDPATRTSIASLARDLVGSSGPLVTSGRFQPEGPVFEAGCVTGWVGAFNEPTFHCHVADVVVDVVTGIVRVRRIKAIHDVGEIVSQEGAVGQVLGGVMQGLGYALLEEIRYDAFARASNPNFHDYRIPTFADAPGLIEVEFVTDYSTSQGFRGLKGVGEAPAIPGAAAIGSAIRAAIGAQPDALPMSSERIAALADLFAVMSS